MVVRFLGVYQNRMMAVQKIAQAAFVGAPLEKQFQPAHVQDESVGISGMRSNCANHRQEPIH